ncbi:Mechanosensitive ion channel family protein [Minicystis rosea]|nr:Mechanosensitive ion channel family protein [Minicystis rosea]
MSKIELVVAWVTRIAAWMGRPICAVIATVLMLWIMSRLGRMLGRAADRIDVWMKGRGRGVAFRSVELLSVQSISQFSRSTVGIVRVALSLTVFYVWLVAVAWALDRSNRVFDFIVRPLVSAFEAFWNATVAFIPNLLTLVVIVVIARFATRTIDVISAAIEDQRLQLASLEPSLAAPVRRLGTIAVWLFALVMAVPYLPGSESKAFQGVSLVVGVLLSLGSSSVVSNLLSGLVLTYTRVYQVGDRIKLSDVIGDVVTLGTFTTRVRTIKDEEIVIPNAVVLNGAVTNFSAYAHDRGVQVHTQVTIGYETPWRTVHRLLIQAALATDGVRRVPEPYVLQRALDDFYVRYEVCAFTNRANTMHIVEAQMNQAIQDEFFREGVEICSPHYESFRDGNKPAIPNEMRGPAPSSHAPHAVHGRMEGKRA